MQLAEVTAMGRICPWLLLPFTATTRNRPMVTWLDRLVGNQRLGRRMSVVWSGRLVPRTKRDQTPKELITCLSLTKLGLCCTTTWFLQVASRPYFLSK
jgi:hypothetical protein